MLDILFLFVQSLYVRIVDLIVAPFEHPAMIWIIVPLVASVFFMELYFGRYPREEMGYHLALENTIFLIFVSVDLVRYLMVEHIVNYPAKIFLVSLIILYSIAMAILDFFHKLPRNIAFRISSKAVVGYTAYIGIVLVYSDILMDLSELSIITTVCAVLILFLVYNLVISTLKFFQPKHRDEVDDLLKDVESDLKLTAEELKKK